MAVIFKPIERNWRWRGKERGLTRARRVWAQRWKGHG